MSVENQGLIQECPDVAVERYVTLFQIRIIGMAYRRFFFQQLSRQARL